MMTPFERVFKINRSLLAGTITKDEWRVKLCDAERELSERQCMSLARAMNTLDEDHTNV